MISKSLVSRVIWYGIGGFLLIIGLSWLTEFIDLSPYIGGPPSVTNWRENVMETLIITLIAIPMIILTTRLISRVHYLEGFLSVCAWCKKVAHNGEWIEMDEYFELKFDMETSHGICLICDARMRAEMAARKGFV